MGQSAEKVHWLKEAIEEGEVALPEIGRLLDSGLSVNTKIDYASVLHYAVSRKQTAVVEYLLDRGADVQLGYFTETPLHCAAVVGVVPIVSALLAKGAELNAKNHNGCTPLWYAVQAEQLSVVQHLLEQTGIDVDCPCDDTFLKSTARTTALSLAVQNRKVNIVHALLAKGPNLDFADVTGRTPLHYACQLGNLTLAECLVQHGCMLDVIDNFGDTPVHTAVCHDSAEIVRLLLNAGCDVNLRRLRDNYHPLHSAAERGNAEIVATLCTARNIDVNCRDRYKKTPLILACKSGNIVCLRHLLGSGADANVQDGNGLTVLSLAMSLEEEPSLLWRLSGLAKDLNNCHQDGCHKEGDFPDGYLGNSSNGKEKDTASVVMEDERVVSGNSASVAADDHRKGVSACVADYISVTAFSRCLCRTSSLDVLHVLIQGGADLNLKDDYGKTALYYAFQLLKLQSACLLLCHGAAVSQTELAAAASHANGIKLPQKKFIHPAVVALTLTSFEFWNCLHHFFYRSDFCDENCSLFGIMKDLQQPMTLTRQCRSVIRKLLAEKTSKSVAPLISKLPLPDSLKLFLLLSDVVEIVCSCKM